MKSSTFSMGRRFENTSRESKERGRQTRMEKSLDDDRERAIRYKKQGHGGKWEEGALQWRKKMSFDITPSSNPGWYNSTLKYIIRKYQLNPRDPNQIKEARLLLTMEDHFEDAEGDSYICNFIKKNRLSNPRMEARRQQMLREISRY